MKKDTIIKNLVKLGYEEEEIKGKTANMLIELLDHEKQSNPNESQETVAPKVQEEAAIVLAPRDKCIGHLKKCGYYSFKKDRKLSLEALNERVASLNG